MKALYRQMTKVGNEYREDGSMKTSSNWDALREVARLQREAMPSWGARLDHMREVYPVLRNRRGPITSAGGALATLYPRAGSFLVGAANPTSIFTSHPYPYARLGSAATIAGLGGLAYGVYHHLTDPPPENLAMDPTAPV